MPQDSEQTVDRVTAIRALSDPEARRRRDTPFAQRQGRLSVEFFGLLRRIPAHLDNSSPGSHRRRKYASGLALAIYLKVQPSGVDPFVAAEPGVVQEVHAIRHDRFYRRETLLLGMRKHYLILRHRCPPNR